jgi:hypothetical protein
MLAQKIKQYIGVPIGTARHLQNNDVKSLSRRAHSFYGRSFQHSCDA